MTISYDKQILIKRGNTLEASSYVGPLGELVLDTTTNRVYVHDGETVGGTLVGDGVGGGGSIYGNTNVAAYLPTDGTITGITTSITTANTNMKGYVDSKIIANVTTANTNMKGYVDSNITTANTNMKGYVDSKITANINAIIGGAVSALDTLNELANALGNDASFSTTVTNTLTGLTNNNTAQNERISALEANIGLSNYGNSNVAAYLPTYGGNIKLGTVVFNDLSEQRTAYTGQQWRTNLSSTLTAKPSWVSYYPDGSKPTIDTNFGFDVNGMWFSGNANDQHAYPIRTNVHFYETDAVEITATFEFNNIGDDHGLAIFLASTTQPYWRFSTDLTRIAFQYSVATPEIRGRTTSSVAGAPVLSTGNTYTIKFVYDPLADINNVTVYTYDGADTLGTLLDTRTITETLPAGDYVIGFDADQDQFAAKSYYTNLTIKTLTNAVFNDIEIVNNLTVGSVDGDLIPSANVAYDLGSDTARWRDLYLSGNTINLGGSTISQVGGAVVFSALPGVDIGLRNVIGWQDYANDVNIAIGQTYTIDSTMGTWGDLSQPGPGPYLDGAFPGIRYAFGNEPAVPAQWSFTYDVNGFVDSITLDSAGDPIQFDDQFEFVWYPNALSTITPVYLGEASTDPIDTTETIWNADGKELYINRDAATNIVSVTGTGWTGADFIPGGLDGRFAVLKLPDDSVIFDGTSNDIASIAIGAVEDCFALSYFIVRTETSYAQVATVTEITNGTTTFGNLIPSANVAHSLGNITHQWKDLWVSNATVYLNSVPLSLNADNTLLVNNVPVVTFTNGNLSVGGNVVNSAVTPYLELTNNPFITQNIVLGNVVTVNAAPAGTNATISVEILAGPNVGNITIDTAGTNYVIGQRYRAYYYNVGGGDNNDDVIFTVANVDVNGGITEITNAQFTGNAATNAPGTYTNQSIDYIASVFDVIGPGLTLTRDNNLGLFNANVELQYDNNEHDSPVGTLWNADGWSVGFNTRSFGTLRSVLNNQIGNYILPAELIMWDTINDNYYKFDFTYWGENGDGGFAYTRQLITDPNYFRKTDNGEEVDIIIPDDGDGAGVGITRAGQNGIYNPYREEGWDSDVSPVGTEWNTDGFDDLSDVTTRTYTNLYAAYGNGGLGNKIPGSQAVMRVPDNGKYYAVEWLEWTQGGNGGGFSYIRRELDLTKVNEGVKFPDGTVLKSAAGVGRVKHTATNGRRIEEVAGDKTVQLTARTTNSLTTVASRAANQSNQVWVDITTTLIDDVIENPQNYNNAYGFQFSTDDINWYNYDFGYSSNGNERGFDIWPGQVTYDQGDTIYFRYFTGGESVVWWDKADLPGGAGNFRGAVIDYHAYTGESTIIGTIHIVDDDGEEHISHQEVQSGSTDGENDDLWYVTSEGQIRYRRIDGESKTLKVQWTAKIFYGSEYYD